ncbi:hypothetical protein AVEN_47515-1 [Araneus ventricosus]|uniref:Uncharacterized protein n=1 Tax=Araneus ventricosus TaxID=182803 RepID=A0A4Y2FH84_ARAVE|nr:hypothetical protein AVEN_47515-1 [Araneus ventricosus]
MQIFAPILSASEDICIDEEHLAPWRAKNLKLLLIVITFCYRWNSRIILYRAWKISIVQRNIHSQHRNMEISSSNLLASVDRSANVVSTSHSPRASRCYSP